MILRPFILACVPRSWAEAMERESRQWICRCPCGAGISIWDVGGLRWKARGSPRRLMHCPACAKWTWHQVVFEPAVADETAAPPEKQTL
jgi:hypothetical protein